MHCSSSGNLTGFGVAEGMLAFAGISNGQAISGHDAMHCLRLCMSIYEEPADSSLAV